MGDGFVPASVPPVSRCSQLQSPPTAPDKGCSSNNNSSSEATVLQRLRTPHSAFMSVLASRHKSLTTVRMMWPRENLRTALDSAILMQDQAVFVDVLRVLVSNR